MEQLDEHEMLVEYSEMTSFDFSSKEFQKAKQDYIECKTFISNLMQVLSKIISKIMPASTY